jgi:hypothetical protein
MTRGLAKIRATMLPRRGLSRTEAAMYLGIGPEALDRFVAQGVIAKPRVIGDSRIWDIRELNLNTDLSPATVGSVYVVGFDNYVKIGFSANVAVRIAQVQQGLPMPLTVYATFENKTRRDELNLHAQFAPYRSFGEWFIKNGDLAEWIDELLGFPEGGAK